MPPEPALSPLQPTNPDEVGGDKAVQDGSGRVWSNEFVTNVTRLRGLLKAAREAIAIGETERAQRVLGAAHRIAANLVARVQHGEPDSAAAGIVAEGKEA